MTGRLQRLSCTLPLLLLALTGCLGTDTGQDEQTPEAGPALDRRISTLITPPGVVGAEFNVARHPHDADQLAIAWMEDADPEDACRVAVSQDGGRTWTDRSPNIPLHRADPWISIGPDGTYHLVCLGSTAEIWTTQSHDQGRTWTTPVDIEEAGTDRPTIHAASDGTIYICTSRSQGPEMTISRDGGATWNNAGLDWVRGGCDGIIETPDGAIYASYHRFDTAPDLRLGAFRSDDAGATWSRITELVQPIHVARNAACTAHGYEDDPESIDLVVEYILVACAVADLWPNGQPKVWILPEWKAAGDGSLYVAYQAFREELPTPGAAQGFYEVRLARSNDGGMTWDHIPLPAEAAPCTDCHQYRPGIAVAPGGELGLRWKRGTMLDGDTHLFATSTDDGRTWTTQELGRTTYAPGDTYDGGWHYWAIEATGDGFVVPWLQGPGLGLMAERLPRVQG